MALLSIVLPAYNEEQNIVNTAKTLSRLMEDHGSLTCPIMAMGIPG